MRRREAGVAMMMAMITMFILALIVGEIAYQSGVYSSIVFRSRDQLRAELLARSGLRLALFQLRATKKARAAGKALGLPDNSPLVDQIWQTPLVLPPPDLPGLSHDDADTLKKFRDKLGFDGTVSVTILGENGRLSINQLAWPPSVTSGADGSDQNGNRFGAPVIDPNTGQPVVPANPPPNTQNPEQQKEQLDKAKKTIHDQYVKLIDNMLEKKRESDDKFREKYAAMTGEILVGNIQGWLDPTITTDGNGREKLDYYNRVEPNPYSPKNAPIVSDSEYHMVEGLDDTLAKMISDNFTTQSTSSLDVNKASLLLIHSLIPELTPDALTQLDKRRNDAQQGPFQSGDDFWKFLESIGNYSDAQKRFKDQHLTILGTTQTYHVVITAHVDVTNTNKTWLADIGPLPPAEPGAVSTSTSTNTNTATPPASPSPPPKGSSTSTNTSANTNTDDYDSLSVIYLKAE